MKSKPIYHGMTLWLLALWLATSGPLSASLIHRYSFTSDAKDSVGTAHGTVKGNGATFDGAGHLVLPGGGGSADPADTIAGYVDLPNHIINVLTNLTIETWVTWDGSGSWQRIFDLGTSSAGEDVSSGNGNYLFMSPQGDVNLRFAVRDPATGTEPVQLTAGAPLDTGTEICLTVTYDYTSNSSRLYSNSVLLVSGPASVALKTIDDVNNWLGRSQWGDPMFQGSYNEFRIYDNPLNNLEVAASYNSGPDKPSTDASVLGAIQAVHLLILKTTMTAADVQLASATADYPKGSGIQLAGVTGVSFQSDTPGVATISSTGTVTAVGAGTAKLTVSFSGKTDSVSITVNARQTGVAVAGTLYVDLHASDLKNGTATWPNKTGKGDFTAAGTPTYDASVAGTGLAGVTFNGTTDAYAGPNSTTDLDGNSDRSIEVWAYNPDIAQEETLVAWGHRGGPNRSNMSFNFGANTSYGAVGHWGEDVGWNGAPSAGGWHYLTYTYDGVSLVKVYADGLLKNTRTYAGGLTTWADLPIRIAAQCNTSGDDFDFGQALSGSLALVRVHGGQLSDNDVKNNFFFGAELTDPGALAGVTLKVPSPTLIGVGSQTTARVTANYANRNYLDVTGMSVFESSDPTVVTVDNSGKITTLKLGSATIKATYQGKQASQAISVLSSPPPALKHRYSFSEAAGALTLKDSVGTANGTLMGDLSLGGGFTGTGKLSLPGGGSASGAPYIDFPNGLVSGMTNATFEAWVTWQGAGPGGDTWQRIFDFGSNSAGEDAQGTGQTYLVLTPRGGAGTVRFVATVASNGAEVPILDGAAPLTIGQPSYVAVSYDAAGQTARLYVNGKKVASGTAPIALKQIVDVNVWLGRSNWNDPYFFGDFDEFRIWEGAMADDQVAADFTAGPDTIPSGPTAQPSLGIGTSAKNVVITWPANATGFVLESSTALGTQAKWSKVATSPVVDNGQNKVTIPIGATTEFYRLKQ